MTDNFNTGTRLVSNYSLYKHKQQDFMEKNKPKICPDCGCLIIQTIPYSSIKCPRCGIPMEKYN